jgi:hypothetical protein
MFWTLYGSVYDNVLSTTLGDGNSEIFLDLNDYEFFGDTYNSESDIPAGPPAYEMTMDFNLDGFVDLTDFTAFNNNYSADWAF